MIPARQVAVMAFFLAAAVAIATAPQALAKPASWRTYAEKTDDWYRGSEGKRITANILSHQSDLGDWPKNIDNSLTLPGRTIRAISRSPTRPC
jgi:pectate lyase